MWDFAFVIPSLLILAIFVGYYFSLPRIPIRMNRTFIILIIIECVVMTMDIISSYADMNYQDYPRILLYALNSAYFIFFFARGHFFFEFTASVLRLNVVIDRKKRNLIAAPLWVSTLIVLTTPFTKWFYYMDETGYHSAPLYNLLYVVFWLYLLLSFICVGLRKDNIRRKRELQSTFWYNVVLLVGTFIRLLFPGYLLMDTFCLIALVIIYLSFENPDFYIEGRTWTFNSRALQEYLEEINGYRRFRIYVFTIHNYSGMREIYGIRQMNQGICLMGDFLRKRFPGNKSFYYRNGRFAILCENEIKMEEVNKALNERFASSWDADETEIYVDIGSAFIDPGDKKIPFNILMQVLMYAFEEAENAENDEVNIIDDSLVERARQEIEIKKAIEFAIENDAIEVYLQPIVDATTRKLVGAEALSRIKDADGKMISPGLFIPVAERNGRINQVGKQVFIKTCEFIKQHDMEKLGLSWINVNLSPIQFMRVDLGKNLAERLRTYGIDPSFIHLEITEEAMVDDQLLVNQTKAIDELGFRFVLDDYGKGYSNMTRLKRCPFINIKLDMSVVWDYCGTPDEMLPNMVEAFSHMGFGITAEGIETEEMATKMAAIGCKYLQGFYFSKPLPMDEFINKYYDYDVT